MKSFQDYSRGKSAIYMEESVKRDGYPLEKFTVTTKDGYINIMYRIRHGKDGENSDKSKPAVILNHGMICCSGMFVVENPLAYYLAENGFDVWLPNNRGTSFSTEHADFDAEEEKDRYWNFNLHEIAVYDLPAFIDFVLEQTGEKKVCLIGFSQGCSIFAMMAAEMPEYNEKISLSILFGSPILFKNVGFFPVKTNIYLLNLIMMVMEKIFRMKLYKVPTVETFRYILPFCGQNKLLRKLVEQACWNIIGYKDCEQIHELDLSRVSKVGPDSSSKYQILHFGQMILSGRFAKYDYGTEKNMELYGAKEPPLYDLSKVTAPIVVFYGKNDMYNNYRKDNLKEIFGGIVHEHIIDYNNYNHVDFLYAKDNINLLYVHAVKYMKNYCADSNKQID